MAATLTLDFVLKKAAEICRKGSDMVTSGTDTHRGEEGRKGLDRGLEQDEDSVGFAKSG